LRGEQRGEVGVVDASVSLGGDRRLVTLSKLVQMFGCADADPANGGSILTKESPIDPDKALSRVEAGAGTRGGRSCAALRRAFEHGSARSRERQAVELSARLQGRNRS
jgi:hypothetical protein